MHPLADLPGLRPTPRELGTAMSIRLSWNDRELLERRAAELGVAPSWLRRAIARRALGGGADTTRPRPRR
jgi:hypothetical protein